MKCIFQLALLVGLLGVCPIAKAQISNLAVDSLFVADTITYIITNNGDTSVHFSYIITQDEYVLLSEGDTIIPPYGQINLKEEIDQSYDTTFELELQELEERAVLAAIQMIPEYQVFPNPFKGRLTITCPDCIGSDWQVSLWDYAGRLVYGPKQMLSTDIQFSSINLDLPAGPYVLRIEEEDRLQVVQVMKY